MRKILFWFLCIFMTSNCFSSPSDDHSLYCYNAYIGIHLRIDLENDYIVANGNDFKKIASISPNGKNYLVITTQPYINSKGIDSYITIFDDATGIYLDLRNAATNEELDYPIRLFCQ